MTKRLTPVALVALLLAVGSVSLASAGSSGQKPADTKSVQDIKLVAQNGPVTALLGEDEQLSVGDQFVFGQDLFRRDGTKFGTAEVVCTVVRFEPPHETDQCVATGSLHKGHLTTHGLVTFTEGELEPSTLAVTGGTDAYRTAHGELIVERISDTEQRLTYKLIL
jgi:hypothetical protein